ncbi:hypothetical protein EV127DRAFT_79516 [Xylaria flabelliformis]|nr:hypothetical protein EV127DRAFT_79516 [Xylaria flabelliformis]
MVYCGKPSQACQMCKNRRIKCDYTRPTCLQCAKSRRPCPGYKDAFDLVFRNETEATERRAKRASKKSLVPKVERRDSLLPEAPSTSFASSSGTSALGTSIVPSSPEIPVEELAHNLFISNFILLPKDDSTAGHLDFVLPLREEAGPDSHIYHAFNACAMVFLNNRKAAGGRYWDKALSEYNMAIAKTNAALRNKESQLSDATLAAVLLLGMFENISAKQISAFNWGSHIDGAVALVKLRGKEQVKTQVGFQLFLAVRTLMSVYCLTAFTAPKMGAEWWLDNTTFSKTAVVVQRLMIKSSEIRAEAIRLIDSLTKSPENIELMLDVIRKAQAVDQEVVAWQESLPEDWHLKTVAWEDSVMNGDCAKAEVFPGRVDVYSDVWIGTVCNSARALRLILQSMSVRCAAWVCAPVDYRTTPEYATAASVCRDAITDIIASVPYFLGWHLRRKEVSHIKTNFGTFPCGEEDTAKGLAGYLITWPLTCVISQDYATDAQRAWVVGRLRKIGNELGVKYALAMCQLQMRVPSMMIRRDMLMRADRPAVNGGYGLVKIVEARLAPPVSPEHALNPHQQWEAVQQKRFEQGKAELIEKLTKNTADDAGAQRAASRWLKMEKRQG